MTAILQYEFLSSDQLAGLRTALESEHMPVADLHSAQVEFLRFHDHDQTVGYAGLEGIGSDLLLRSLWVSPARRNFGLGGKVLNQVESRARDRGCRTLHLMTTTADRFFIRHGYTRMTRSLAPEGIAASREFVDLCPASAIYLTKRLERDA